MQPSHFQERKYRRFSVRCPVQVLFDVAGSVSELEAISNNVSLGGILLEAATPIPPHCDVTFAMAVPEHHIVGGVQLAGEGEVVRVESHPVRYRFCDCRQVQTSIVEVGRLSSDIDKLIRSCRESGSVQAPVACTAKSNQVLPRVFTRLCCAILCGGPQVRHRFARLASPTPAMQEPTSFLVSTPGPRHPNDLVPVPVAHSSHIHAAAPQLGWW